MATRIVLDTNVLVANSWRPDSASGQIVAACLRGDLTAVLSAALRREYEFLIGRAIRSRAGQQAVADVIARAELVEPTEVPRVVAADREDDKVVAAAVAAGAFAIVTNDAALLALDPHRAVRIVQPADFLTLCPSARGQANGGTLG